jgi:hypothetical protein
MRRILGLVTLAALTACAPQPDGGGKVTVPDLLPSVQATAQGDSVRFVLQVTNTTAEAVELEYRTGQAFDFVVLDEAGREVWRWSDGRMFTQAVRHESLGPGETITHAALWSSEGRPAEAYAVVGSLTVADRSVQQRTEFRLP